MEKQENNSKEIKDESKTYMQEGMSIGMCIGTAIGVVIGIFINNIPICICFGISIGLCIGLGIGFVIIDLAKRKFKELEELKLNKKIPNINVYLATNKSISLTFASKTFIKYINS